MIFQENHYMEKILGSILFVLLLQTISFAQVITGGDWHSLVLCSDSTVINWGRNRWGQLGNGTQNKTWCCCKSTPVQVSGLGDIIALAGGGMYSVALKSDETVWAWGLNNYGQLGDGTTTNKTTPVQVSGLKDIIAIAAGRGLHSLALKKDSTVWAWGLNNNYQLGNLNYTTVDCYYKSTPMQVRGLTSITAIAVGGTHSLALKKDGTVWMWGKYNNKDHHKSVVIYKTPMQVSGLTGITVIAAGSSHSLALKNDSTVWSFGQNDYGQLSDGDTTYKVTPVQVSGLSGIIAIAEGNSHSLALKNDGTVWAWGRNQHGQLGDGTTKNKTIPVQVTGLKDIIAIAGGHSHSLALQNNGTIWAWGRNQHGQLGDATTTKKTIPVKYIGVYGSQKSK